MNYSKVTVKQRENKGGRCFIPNLNLQGPLHHCTGYGLVSPSVHLLLFVKKTSVFVWVTHQGYDLVPVTVLDISIKHSKICVSPFSSFNNVI